MVSAASNAAMILPTALQVGAGTELARRLRHLREPSAAASSISQDSNPVVTHPPNGHFSISLQTIIQLL